MINILHKHKAEIHVTSMSKELEDRDDTPLRVPGMPSWESDAELLVQTEEQELKELQLAFKTACLHGGVAVDHTEEPPKLSPECLAAMTRSLVEQPLLIEVGFEADEDFDKFMSYQVTDFPHKNKWTESFARREREVGQAADAFGKKDFFVTVNELRAQIPELDPSISKEELDALCVHADTNNNGTIDYHEFIHMLC